MKCEEARGRLFSVFLCVRLWSRLKERAAPRPGRDVRGDMVFFINAKNTQTTAWRVLTEPTEHTCKALASVEAPTLRNTYDFSPIFS